MPLVYEGGVGQVFSTLAASPVAATVAALSEAQRAGLADAAQRHVGRLVRDGQVRTQMVSNIARARKP